jgi:hypothetical protein
MADGFDIVAVRVPDEGGEDPLLPDLRESFALIK